MDKIRKAPNGFIESGKDPAKLLQVADATRDEVTFFVKMAVIRPLDFAIRFRWDHRSDSLAFDMTIDAPF